MKGLIKVDFKLTKLEYFKIKKDEAIITKELEVNDEINCVVDIIGKERLIEVRLIGSKSKRNFGFQCIYWDSAFEFFNLMCPMFIFDLNNTKVLININTELSTEARTVEEKFFYENYRAERIVNSNHHSYYKTLLYGSSFSNERELIELLYLFVMLNFNEKCTKERKDEIYDLIEKKLDYVGLMDDSLVVENNVLKMLLNKSKLKLNHKTLAFEDSKLNNIKDIYKKYLKNEIESREGAL